MALILYVAKIAVDKDTGQALPELQGQGGTIIARGNPSTLPTIYEDKDGSLAIPGSAVTVNENGFTGSFWVDEADLPISWWDGSVEVPLESVEGIAVRLDDLEVLFSDTAQSAAAAQSAAEAAQAAAEAVELSGGVLSVANKTGHVSLVRGDVGLGNVNNTADVDKPVSSAMQTALNGKLGAGQSIPVSQVTGLQSALDSKRGQNDPIDGSLVQSGRISPARLGSGSVGDSARYLASDGVWRAATSGSGGGGLLSEVVVYGDSQVSNDVVYGGTKRFGQLLSDVLGIPVSEQGYGGATSLAVAGMAGASLVYVTLQGNQIPSSGNVGATDIENPAALQSEANQHYGYIRGTRVLATGGGYGSTRQFSRFSPGDAVAVPPGTAFVSERATAGFGRAAIMMCGGNDPGHSITAQQRIDAYVAVGRKFGARFIAMSSMSNGHHGDGAIDTATEAGLEDAFGDQYLNVRAFLCERGAAWAGITLSPEDETRAAAGAVPHAFYHTDSVHLNEIGRSVLARRVAQMLQASGFIAYAGGGSGSSDTTPPTVPTGLSASSVAETSFTLSWTASTDDVAVAAYDIYIDGGFLRSVTGTTTSITGLTQGTGYGVTVRARDAAGNTSATSGALNVTTLSSSDTTAPSAPTGLGHSSVTSTGATITWNASTDNVGVTGYQVVVDGVSRPEIGNVLSESISGLSAETEYEVRVRARDAAGNWSSLSAALAVTTLAPPSGTLPIAPQYRFDAMDGTIASGRAVNMGGDGATFTLASLASNGTPNPTSDVAATTLAGVPCLKSASNKNLGLVESGAFIGQAGLLSVAAVLMPTVAASGTYLKAMQLATTQDGAAWNGYFGWSDAPKVSSKGDGGGEDLVAHSVAALEPILLLMTYEDGGLGLRAWVNGVQATGTAEGWLSETYASFLRVAYQVGVAEMIGDKRPWSPSEVTQLNDYFMAKYGIA